MLVVNRALRRIVVPVPTSLDGVVVAALLGLVVIWALGTLESWATRDGFAVLQRFGLPAACLAIWIGIFRFQPVAASRSPEHRPWWPAAGALALAGLAAVFIGSQSAGSAWGVLAISIASYLALFGAAALRRQPGGWGLALIVLVEVIMAVVAFTVLPAPLSPPAAAVGAVVVLGGLLALRRTLRRPFAPLDELAHIARDLRAYLPALVGTAAAGMLLSLAIGGQTAALSRLVVPLAGIAASRLVAEEILLRGWMLPTLERRLGTVGALLLAAAFSAMVAAAVRPTVISPYAAAAAAFAAALAAGVLARRTRCTPAVVLFRLLTG